MKKVFFLLVLLLAPFLGLADPHTALNASAVTNHTDLSIQYLNEIFGTVGNVLQGGSGQMLGHLLLNFNEGIVYIAGGWLIYSVFIITVRASTEGAFMGQNRNVALLFLRIALGMSLLIPNSTTGYNLLQDVVMKVAVAGVKLADTTWNSALGYLSEGGAVWRQPNSFNQGNDPIAAALNPTADYVESMLGKSHEDKSYGLMTNVMASEVCMLASTQNSVPPDYSNGSNDTGIGVSAQPARNYDVLPDKANSQFVFPGGSADPSKANTYCGTVSYNVNNACAAGAGSSACLLMYNATYQLIDTLKPAAKAEFCSQGDNATEASVCAGADTDGVAESNEQVYLLALASYANAIMPVVQEHQQDSGNKYKDFIKEAKKEGWISAGRYYWDISQIGWRYQQGGNLATYTANLTSPGNISINPIKNAYDGAMSDGVNYKPRVRQLLTNLDNAANAGGTGSPTSAGSDAGLTYGAAAFAAAGSVAAVGGTGGLSFIAAVFPIINDMGHIIALFNTNNVSADPIVFLHSVGMACLNTAGDLWLLIPLLLAGIITPFGICNAEVDMKGSMQIVGAWLRGFMFALAAALFSVGALLGFYVPLYPWIIFSFGVVGWMVAVIEAMVAAPLVAFGLTHPEGHDFLGPVQQSLMLMLSLFLRPVLLLIGLIAGMILSYVSLRMIIYSFSGIVSDLFYTVAPQSGAASNDILHSVGNVMGGSIAASLSSGSIGGGLLMVLIIYPIMLGIFTMVVFTMTTMCYQLTNQFVNYIMMWIGGPQLQNMAGQFANQIQQSFGGIAGQMTRAGQAGFKGAQDKTADAKAQQKADLDVGGANSDAPGTSGSGGGDTNVTAGPPGTPGSTS